MPSFWSRYLSSIRFILPYLPLYIFLFPETFCAAAAVWPDVWNVCSIFGHLQLHKLAQKYTEFSKVGSNVWQIQIKPSKSCRIFLKFCRSGEILPNMVTLSSSNIFSRHFKLSFSFVRWWQNRKNLNCKNENSQKKINKKWETQQ